jgi:hypothetical protein
MSRQSVSDFNRRISQRGAETPTLSTDQPCHSAVKLSTVAINHIGIHTFEPGKSLHSVSILHMCSYTDKVYRCGHYDRSVDPCDAAKAKKSLCELPDPKQKKKAKSTTNVSVATGTWCPHEHCDEKSHNKRPGPGNHNLRTSVAAELVDYREDGGFDEANYQWEDDDDDEEGEEDNDDEEDEDPEATARALESWRKYHAETWPDDQCL